MMGANPRLTWAVLLPLFTGLIGWGCSGRSSLFPDPSDATDVDAYEAWIQPDVAPPDATPSCAAPDRPPADPQPWSVGDVDTFEVVTWNIRQFPIDASTPDKVADLIWQMGADLVAVQEIADVVAFWKLVCALPGYDGVLSSDQYGTGEYQKTGLIYRVDQVTVQAVSAIFPSDNSAFPRPPLKADIEVHLPNGVGARFTLIDVHLKAGIDGSDAARRQEALARLKNFADDLQTATPDVGVMIVGDFNDSPADAASDNVFTPFLDDPSQYAILTLPLAQADEYSYIPYPSLLDHIIVTTSLAAGGFTDILELDEQITAFDYEDQVSDHRPVVSILPMVPMR